MTRSIPLTALGIVLCATFTFNPASAESQATPAPATISVPAPVVPPAIQTPPAASSASTPAPAAAAVPAPAVAPAAPPVVAPQPPAGTEAAADPAATPAVANCHCKGKDDAAKIKDETALRKIADENAATTEFDSGTCKLKCKEGFKVSPYKSFKGACVSADRYEAQMNAIRLTQAQQDLKDLKTKVDGLPEELKKLWEDRIKTLEGNYSALSESVGTVTTAVTGFRSELATAMANMETILTDIEGLKQSDKIHDVRLDNAEIRLTAIEDYVTADPTPYFAVEGGAEIMAGTNVPIEDSGEEYFLRFSHAEYALVSVSGGLCAPRRGHCFGGAFDGITGSDTGYGWGLGGRVFAEFAVDQVASLGFSLGGQYTAGGWEEGQALHESPDVTAAFRARIRIPVPDAVFVPTLGIELGGAFGSVMYLEDESDPSGRFLGRVTFGATRRHAVYQEPELQGIPVATAPEPTAPAAQ